MTDQNEETQKPNIQANDNSVAVGNLNVGGSIGGDLTIGNTYNYSTSEDDAPLSSEELEIGLTRFVEYLPERAPILQEKFAPIAKKMRATLGAELSALSSVVKTRREDTVNQMKLMCMEVLDISFRALCMGQNPPPYDSRSPFQGLVAFRPESKEFYFGREALIQKLVTRLEGHPFLAVMGASGSGKSSLVMAGLIPTLEAQMAYLTPSDAPLDRLQAAQENTDKDTVYVVDQFEELFTHTPAVDAREAFIQELLALTKTNRVVITMRADFLGEVAAHNDLNQAIQNHMELIAPMNTDELHAAMEQQAAAVGLRFDAALSESILEEVKGAPGAMPLLQHALWMLWKRRHGLWLKAEEYRAFGGVNQAIASTADEVYASCPDFERDRIQNIFLRLTRLDDSGEGRDTRRRVLIEDLFPVNSDTISITQLLNKLADARLIVKTETEVEVAHEALIRHWSRLTNWLNEDRDNLRLREGVSEDAREWEKSKRDEALLNHRGGRLELALTMSQNPRYLLNPIEQAYLNACVEVRELARIEKEQQQQRELESAKKLTEIAQAQAKAERRGRLVTIGMLVAAVVLVGVLSYDPIRRELLRRQAMESKMVNIPAGEYFLGDQEQWTPDNPDWFLPYQVYTIPAFTIDVYPVSNKRYGFCIQAGICSRPNSPRTAYEGEANEEKPVVNITSINAAEFCNWIGFRLPNDKEWELAVRKQGLKSVNGIWEWTRSPYIESMPEWLNVANDPPEVLTQKGGTENLKKNMTYRQSAVSTQPGDTTGFRCTTNFK